MQGWYDIVRAAAPNNIVLVGTPTGVRSSPPGDAALDLEGSNVVYVAHMYPIHFSQPSLRAQITTAAAAHPIMLTEWGFQSGANSILDSTITAYGTPFKQFVEDQRLSWTAWCASDSWQPVMFKNDFSLEVGEGWLGGFAKDWLYEKRNDDQPAP